MNQFFSIIIPTYNRAGFLPRAIDSVLAQRYGNWELIIVDDGSTDNTHEVVSAFKDERVRYVYQENAERSAARNNGIHHAKAEWICFLDSDDEYMPEHLQTLIDEINAQGRRPGLYCTGLLQKSETETKEKPFLKETDHWVRAIYLQFLLPDQVCVHKSILNENRFDVRFRIWEDTHLWMRIAAQYPFYQLKKYTCVQHVHANSTVQQGMKEIKWEEVKQYVDAIMDLRVNYGSLMEHFFSLSDSKNYVDSKYRMYLYQARKNKQKKLALKIWWNAMKNKPSFYLCTELLKIPLG